MRVIADLHLHSRFSRATSKQLTISNLEKYARIKGLSLLGTGDFTHPKWLAEIREKLKEDGTGILRTDTGFPFVLQSEISLIYSQAGKCRKVHIIMLSKSLDIVSQINEALLKKGRLDYDGRPIFGMSCIELADMIKSIDKDIEIIPAHIWTPWFSIFGSMSGFDSVKECFGEREKMIHAIETGLSSDPAMNWRVSSLDKYSLISNSDSHSFWPWRIGREFNVFEMKNLSYEGIARILSTKEGFEETIEFFPEEGKYHYDGHRACNIVLKPSEAMKLNNICPVCRKPLTIGVMHRVEELADRPLGFRPKNAVPFRNLIPLAEVIAGAMKSSVSSKKVTEVYYSLIKNCGNEMKILLETESEKLCSIVDAKVAELIIRNREQKIPFRPGYDGVYGEPIFFENDEKQERKSQDKKTESGSSKIKEKKRAGNEPMQKSLGDY